MTFDPLLLPVTDHRNIISGIGQRLKVKSLNLHRSTILYLCCTDKYVVNFMSVNSL